MDNCSLESRCATLAPKLQVALGNQEAFEKCWVPNLAHEAFWVSFTARGFTPPLSLWAVPNLIDLGRAKWIIACWIVE